MEGRTLPGVTSKSGMKEHFLTFFLDHTGVPTIQGPVIIPFHRSHTTFPTQSLFSLNMKASDSSETLPN